MLGYPIGGSLMTVTVDVHATAKTWIYKIDATAEDGRHLYTVYSSTEDVCMKRDKLGERLHNEGYDVVATALPSFLR